MAKLFIAKGLPGVCGFARGPAVRIRQGLPEQETPGIDAADMAEELHVEEPPAVVAAEVCLRAAPFVVNGLLSHLLTRGRAHRIVFDVVESGPKVRLGHRAREETVLPKMARAVPPSVEVLGETAMDSAQQDGERVFLGWRCDEVYVVGHQAVSEDGHLGVGRLFAEEIEVNEMIGTSPEGHLTGSSALSDMVRHAGRCEPCSSRHSKQRVLAGLPESQRKPGWDGLSPFPLR